MLFSRNLLFACLFITILFSACAKKKQRDVRKLNWYEVVTDARGKNIRVLMPANEISNWTTIFSAAETRLKAQSVQVKFSACETANINDSLANSLASLVMIGGAELDQALKNGYLHGPFDRLLPISKKINTDSDAFRNSNGISTQGFAVPIRAGANEKFFAIPQHAESQAAALLILETLLELQMEADSSVEESIK